MERMLSRHVENSELLSGPSQATDKRLASAPHLTRPQSNNPNAITPPQKESLPAPTIEDPDLKDHTQVSGDFTTDSERCAGQSRPVTRPESNISLQYNDQHGFPEDCQTLRRSDSTPEEVKLSQGGDSSVQEPIEVENDMRRSGIQAGNLEDHASVAEKKQEEAHSRDYFQRFIINAKKVIFATVLYALTSYCAATASIRHSPLALISPPHGVLLLHVLSKASDIGLGFAIGAVWDSFQWTSIVKGSFPLITFFSLSKATKMSGLLKILRSQIPQGHSARLWSTIAGHFPDYGTWDDPDVVADVKTVNVYFPLQWTNISGGIGVFDASLTDDFTSIPGPYLAGLVQYLLRDPEIAYEVQSISDPCGTSLADCVSYLISGGINNVSPWQFSIAVTNALDYVVKDGPAYQIDYGDGKTNNSWPSSSCQLYSTEALGVQVCIDKDQTTKEITAGWRSCSTQIPELGLCDQPWLQNGTFGWQTSMSVHRRKATITASRISWNILDINTLGTPSLQDIKPTDLFTILDLILSPSQNATANQNSSSYDLSSYMFQFLHLSSKPNAQVSKQPLLYLRNLLTIPLYLCNPVTFTGSSSITSGQTNLPAENQLQGADAVSAIRAVPGTWTVRTYIATAGSILLLCYIVIGINSKFETPKTSSFVIADFLMLTKAQQMGAEGDGTAAATDMKYHDLFHSIKKPGDNDAIMKRASEVKVYMKT